jgi:hypothetical protein
MTSVIDKNEMAVDAEQTSFSFLSDELVDFEALPKNNAGHYTTRLVYNERPVASRDHKGKWKIFKDFAPHCLPEKIVNDNGKFSPILADLFIEQNEAPLIALFDLWFSRFMESGETKGEIPDQTQDNALLALVEHAKALFEEYPDQKDWSKRFLRFTGIFRKERAVYGVCYVKGRNSPMLAVHRMFKDLKTGEENTQKASFESGNNLIAMCSQKGQWYWSTDVKSMVDFFTTKYQEKETDIPAVEWLRMEYPDSIVQQVYTYLED